MSKNILLQNYFSWLHGIVSYQFSSVQSFSRVWLFATPWIAAHQASLSITNSWSSLRLTSIKSVMPSSHLILCRPLLLLPPIPLSIRVFSNEATLHMRSPKYWSFSFSIILSKEIPGNRNIYINNYFKCKWIKCSNQRHRLAQGIQKQDPYICCLQEIHFRPQDTYRLIVRGWKNIFHAHEKQKKAGVAILISEKTDLKIKITRDKEGHYIIIKGSIQEEDRAIVNIYAPNIGAPQYIRQNTNRHKRRNWQ